jgi:hypothetical protein
MYKAIFIQVGNNIKQTAKQFLGLAGFEPASLSGWTELWVRWVCTLDALVF